MGYVLPVDNYQYQQYQNRVVKTKQDPYPIEKPFKTQLSMSYMDQEKQLEKHVEHKKKTNVTGHAVDFVYTEMTGKGYFINERI
ncbi:hypothetical protein NC661_06625 [Aquibacillus koreensis]|uniref:Uncharacterized protein n=1 Tax=Aquibacillus koreensis TaxID=279446 RepID=A0A9X4AJ30_9BACI|nr:hypothetical protein [Aquibacillus koreensis]MCT2535675.1 hypothetical protein [Aquibacillus koreensis]MDC3420040.1 hypothetical protein [Aquibacillus koreensis]